MQRRRASTVSIVATLLGTAACVPDFVDDTTRVTAARIIAIKAEPAEAAESDIVTLEALVATREGVSAPSPSWSLCVDRKPLSELGPVSPRCLGGPELPADIAIRVDPGPPVVATLPDNACQLFGPDRPEPKPGEPSGRPVDPDPTGGFYQPVLGWLSDDPVLGGVRLSCGLIGASPSVTKEYNQRYRKNQNPVVDSLLAVYVDGSVDPLHEPSEHVVRPGQVVRLRVSWPDCPEEGECGGAERYVVYDALSQSLLERTEKFIVSWYATGGVFAAPRTDRAPTVSGESPGAINTWTAPGAGVAAIWAVVHDDRGGQAWIQGSVVISP